MFDWLKKMMGVSTCRGCIYRRCFGLYCGDPQKRKLGYSAWRLIGCWGYSWDGIWQGDDE